MSSLPYSYPHQRFLEEFDFLVKEIKVEKASILGIASIQSNNLYVNYWSFSMFRAEIDVKQVSFLIGLVFLQVLVPDKIQGL